MVDAIYILFKEREVLLPRAYDPLHCLRFTDMDLAARWMVALDRHPHLTKMGIEPVMATASSSLSPRCMWREPTDLRVNLEALRACDMRASDLMCVTAWQDKNTGEYHFPEHERDEANAFVKGFIVELDHELSRVKHSLKQDMAAH